MSIRLNKAIKEFGVGLQSITDLLKQKGAPVASNDPNQKLDDKQYELLKSAFSADKSLRDKAEERLQDRQEKKRSAKATRKADSQLVETVVPDVKGPHIVGHIDLDATAKGKGHAANNGKTDKSDNNNNNKAEAKTAPAKNVNKPQADAAAAHNTKATNANAEAGEAVKASANDSTPSKNQPMTQNSNGNKNNRPSVEERAKAIGEEENGVFKLHTQNEIAGPKVLGTIDLSAINSNTRPKKKSKDERRRERNKQNGGGAQGQNANQANGQRKKRNRIGTERVDVNNAANQPKQNGNNNGKKRNNNGNGNGNNQNRNNQQGGQNNSKSANKNRNRRAKEQQKTEVSDEDVAKQVKETLARLTSKQKGSKGAKYRKEKREQQHQRAEEERREAKAESKVLKLTEFVTANELAQMMDVPVTKVIATCMSIGIMVSINQRMDAETIDLVAEEFGFKTEYVAADVQEAIAEEVDNPEDLEPRAPIVTVMGHVDHGKTSLLDYVRKSNVIAGEAGGITQHIGAYNVTLENGRRITFLDTPGHEAFTAMRARGAQVTDIAIIIIAADDDIMPQTKEAIAHATAANVPIVFAINKVDKPHANPDKIKEGLAAMNFLVEEWGGKYQSQDISAKKGTGVKELLEKVLLEADMLELKANPNRKATGTVIESSLDKGRGYVATILVSNGTLHQGDIVLAGTNYGRVKALFNERGARIDNVGPSMAATLLGFNGAPQAGDQFHVMETEQEAREIANKREQLQREQDLRTREVLTLEKIGKRLKMGSYHELNIIVKADVDGSVEALADSFIKLSTENIVVKVINKGVGQISENDVTLAAASEAIIIGFQVRPSQQARKLAERDGVEIRQYSVIYDAIEDVKVAMEGMLEPVIKEEVTANIEVRQVYHISKVGYVAGCYVIDGKVKRSDKARLIRDGIVIFTGEINALKRFKDDVKEVSTNFECGISLTNCNDIKEGDMIETFQEIEVKQKLQ
ncbi:MAG: translation initiation factor IF-2 [Prevotella sp.]|nr:translation initiation factor IF-2 [Prevotella sp.]MDY5666393.1 translation initiation factor IF-2 [Alloprevotella sp.]